MLFEFGYVSERIWAEAFEIDWDTVSCAYRWDTRREITIILDEVLYVHYVQ